MTRATPSAPDWDSDVPFFEAVRLAFNTIRTQKLKSFFSAVGVCIGVTFLIAVVSIIEGMTQYMTNDFAGKFFAVNTFELRSRPNIATGNVTEEMWREWQRRRRLRETDIDPVAAVLPEDVRWTPISQDNVTVSTPDTRPTQVQAYNTTATYFTIKKMGLVAGRVFTPQEDQIGATVVVIGKDVREKFFKGVDPIGRTLRIGQLPYTVIGVAEEQGSTFGFSLDKFVVAPYRSPLRRITNRQKGVIDAIMIQSPTEAAMTGNIETVRELMRVRRGLRPTQPDDFALETGSSAIEFFTKIKQYLTLAGVALPAIGLIVGAMVIMNIMLVAVAERTREIGVRKSLGARRRDILSQFLVESATLSMLGAGFGVALGFGLAFLVAAVSPLPAAVSMSAVVLAVVVGAGVGIVAGVYPASRAARLDPVVALRSE
jgi:putative ABC transport system permease protein